MRATLNWIEFNAIALVRSCLPTSEGISDWYAGPPNACAVPVIKESSRMCHTSTTPKYTSAARMAAVESCTHCDAISVSRRSWRSATTPPMSVNSMIGSCCRNASRPR